MCLSADREMHQADRHLTFCKGICEAKQTVPQPLI